MSTIYGNPILIPLFDPSAKIYGVDFTNMATSSVGTRTNDAANFTDPQPAVAGGTGSSPFDSIMPWCGMKRFTHPDAGEVVSIPKFYYKWITNGTKMTGLQISMTKHEGFNTSPSHMDRGDGKGERDVIYVGRYHSCSTNKSTTGQLPKVNITRSAARTAVHSLGSNIWQFDYATRVTIWMLYLVEFADWDASDKIGFGAGNNSSVENVGASDSMQYHTGTMQPNRRDDGVGVQYRYIEGLWDNAIDWMDGCYYSANGMFIILNPNSFSDTTNGTVIGIPVQRYPATFSVPNILGLEWAIYPSESKSDNSNGTTDEWQYNSASPCLKSGAYYNGYWARGLFYVSCVSASSTAASTSFRVLILPS